MKSTPSAVLSTGEYRLLVEQAPILIWRSDTTGACDYFNQRWLEFTGRTLEQERGDGWAEGVHPEDYQRCLDIYLSHFKVRAVFEMEYRLRRHDGQFRWVFDRGVSCYDDQGEFVGYIGSCVDVTERVEAQRALKEAQEAQVRTLTGLLPICMYCKKIRDDKGYWSEVEKYIQAHTSAEFSHGICQDCKETFLKS